MTESNHALIRARLQEFRDDGVPPYLERLFDIRFFKDMVTTLVGVRKSLNEWTDSFEASRSPHISTPSRFWNSVAGTAQTPTRSNGYRRREPLSGGSSSSTFVGGASLVCTSCPRTGTAHPF